MIVLAFIVLMVMLAAYVLLDGYDLGSGAMQFFVARGDRERTAVLDSIGPYWNGNEVWLIAAGGTLFALFPKVYASSFSGFYLPFMVLLWLLMFRGIAFELRGQLPSDLWRSFFDVTFSAASVLLILLLGVALGNVLRGVPLDKDGYFLGTFAFLLNPYALGVGLLAVAALAQHGAAWIAARVQGAPALRAAAALRVLWPIVLVLTLVMTIATLFVHSPLPNLRTLPAFALAPLASFAGLLAVAAFAFSGRAKRVLAASMVFLAGLMASAAFTLFPYLLPGFPAPETGLSIFAEPPSPVALATILTIAIAGLLIVAAYRTFVERLLNAPPAQPEAPQS
jgi:cytochrome d ubiquinol oxidase subunit II